MLEHARILILEDDRLWQATLNEVLGPVAEHVTTVATLPEALGALEQCYFNVALVDLSLHDGDAKDAQGLEFLRQLNARGLEDTVRCIILSAYGTTRRVRDAFREYRVIDFQEKGEFSARELTDAVQRALAANHLDRPLAIEVSNGHALSHLWDRFGWAQREDSRQLQPELYDLLRRLFPAAESLFIRDLPAGQSGAGVLQVEPYYPAGAGTPVVVKFGKKDKIGEERDNYDQYVQQFVGVHSSTQFRCALGRVMGAICYQLVGTAMNDVVSFAGYYRKHSADAVGVALDHLFRHACGQWYNNREGPRRSRDLVKLYEKGLHMVWAEVWDGAQATGVDLGREAIELPGVAGKFVNPRLWLEAHSDEAQIPVWQAMTHGDLNEHNILVTEDGHCWLIDFYRTGPGHILRDAIELETAIKFNLAGIDDLAEFQRFERRLLSQTRLDQSVEFALRHPRHKPLAVISQVRKLADPLAGANNEATEYYWGLLLTTLNLLRLPMMQSQRRKALLSAALICERLTRAG